MVMRTTFGADFSGVCAAAEAALRAIRKKKIRRKEGGIGETYYLTDGALGRSYRGQTTVIGWPSCGDLALVSAFLRCSTWPWGRRPLRAGLLRTCFSSRSTHCE